MADIEFRITGGPYVGNYSFDLGDITANDVGDLLSQGGPDLDDILTGGRPGTRGFAALVWVVRRRGNKGLAYRAVAEHITFAVIAAAEDDPKESAEKSMDPSSSAAAS